MGALQLAWDSFLSSRHGAWLTHGSAALMTAALFALLLLTPFWIAFIPGVILTHRIGVMMHEYIHGIPFRRYASCHNVLTFFDGLTLMFGLLELFRGTHLSHHRWLNSAGDSAFDSRHTPRHPNRLIAMLVALEVTQHLKFYWEALHGRHPYVRRARLLTGLALSLVSIGVWAAVGRPDVIWKLMLLTTFTTAVPVSFRGAIEHHGPEDDRGFANEYRVIIPLFNLNRHIHHHEEPRRPWYLLEFRTAKPLGWREYFTYWFRVYVKKDLVLMHPMEKRPRITDFPT
jgi:fatty acid desaturase